MVLGCERRLKDGELEALFALDMEKLDFGEWKAEWEWSWGKARNNLAQKTGT